MANRQGGRGGRGGSASSKKIAVQPASSPALATTATQKKQRSRGGKPGAVASTSTHTQDPSPQTVSSSSEPVRKSGPSIVWGGRRTDELISWITSHTADRHILFHDRSTSTSSTITLQPGDKPSGKTKKDVSAAIARHIFHDDPDHAVSYSSDSSRYVTSVINRLQTLKANYRELRSRFTSTGGGIKPPGDDAGSNSQTGTADFESPAQNLLEQVLRDCPHYLELDAIWRGIPSFDPDLISSRPKSNHVESLLKVVAPKTHRGVNLNVVSQAASASEDVDIQDDRADVQEEELDEEAPGDMQVDLLDDGDLMVTNSFFDNNDLMNEDSDPPFDSEALQIQPRQTPACTGSRPPTAQSKGKTPVREGRSAFNTRHNPYSRPPSSVGSIATQKSGMSDGRLSSTKPTSTGTASSYAAKISELDRASNALEAASVPRSAVRYNYCLRKAELEIQREELKSKWQHAEADFQREQELKMLDIKLKESEECSISRHIELLNKQMEYMQTMQNLGVTTGAGAGAGLPLIPSPFAAAGSESQDPSAAGSQMSTGVVTGSSAAVAGPSKSLAGFGTHRDS